MSMCTLGVDLGIRATHVATLCDSRGEVVWSKRRFGNRHDELVALVDEIGDCDELTVVMEPTRNTWVPVAAPFMGVGARVVLVPAVSGSAPLLRETHQERPARFPRAGPVAAAPS